MNRIVRRIVISLFVIGLLSCANPVLVEAKTLARPAKVSLTSVKSEKAGAITASYAKVSNAKGYQIQMARNKSFTSGKKTITTSALKATKTGLTKDKVYYVRVRGWNYKYSNKTTRQYGAWSSIKSVRVRKTNPRISMVESISSGRMFDAMIVGDSRTCDLLRVYANDTNKRNNYHPATGMYVNLASKIAGQDIRLVAVNGSSTSSWISGTNHDRMMPAISSTNRIYFALGVNDIYNNGDSAGSKANRWINYLESLAKKYPEKQFVVVSIPHAHNSSYANKNIDQWNTRVKALIGNKQLVNLIYKDITATVRTLKFNSTTYTKSFNEFIDKHYGSLLDTRCVHFRGSSYLLSKTYGELIVTE